MPSSKERKERFQADPSSILFDGFVDPDEPFKKKKQKESSNEASKAAEKTLVELRDHLEGS